MRQLHVLQDTIHSVQPREYGSFFIYIHNTVSEIMSSNDHISTTNLNTGLCTKPRLEIYVEKNVKVFKTLLILVTFLRVYFTY